MMPDAELSVFVPGTLWHDANLHAGPRWQSVLVRTGVWRGEVNDELDPADHVVQHIQEAVQFILESARQSATAPESC